MGGTALSARALLLALAALALAAPAAGARPWSEGFDHGLPGWHRGGAVRTAIVAEGGDRRLRLRGAGRLSHRLGSARWALSLDVRVVSGRGVLALGDRHHALRLAPGGWRHVEASAGARGVWAAVDGRRRLLRGRAGRLLSLAARGGTLLVDDVLASSLADRGALLLHRVADLQARVPPQSFYLGADVRDRLHLAACCWTRGFLAGALWQARALAGPALFEPWALARTRANLGREDADTHDLGFMYETTSLAAWRTLCARGGGPAGCAAFRASALRAAGGLRALAQTNPGTGTIPTRRARPSAHEADTIVDSMMNLPILYWASEQTGDPSYREVGARHALAVARLLVRLDGSTAQSVHTDRATGAVLKVHTHQGISATSTWARGQSWALYGFTTSAAALRDPALLEVARRLASWVAVHLPADGVPRYDYDAPPGAPTDVSAGVVAAAGLERLAGLCATWRDACPDGPRWRALGDRMLTAALARISQRPPLGYLGGQAYTVGGSTRWDDDAELGWGLYYALEAVNLSRASR